MAHVKINSEIINGKKRIQQSNVTTLSIANYGVMEVTFLYNGIRRILPPVDPTLHVPVAAFEIQNNGHHFNIDIEFTQNNTNIVLDYAQLVPITNC